MELVAICTTYIFLERKILGVLIKNIFLFQFTEDLQNDLFLVSPSNNSELDRLKEISLGCFKVLSCLWSYTGFSEGAMAGTVKVENCNI